MPNRYPHREPANPADSDAGASPRRSSAADDRPLGLGEAAEALGVHYMTAYRYVRTGVLEAHQSAGRWRVEPSAVHELQRSRRRGGRSSGANRSSHAPSHQGLTPHLRPTRHPSTDRWRPLLADRLLAGDEAGAWRIVDDAFAAGAELDQVYVDLVGGSLREVGDRWADGRATVADEHRASVVAMRVVGRLGPRAARPGRTRGTVVVGAAPGDRHALPSALLADLLRSRGLRVVDLGADTPPEHLADAAAGTDRLVAVGICATSEVDAAAADDLREAVRLVQERSAAPVLVGGAAAAGSDLATRAGADGSSSHATEALAWFESVASARSAAGRSVS